MKNTSTPPQANLYGTKQERHEFNKWNVIHANLREQFLKYPPTTMETLMTQYAALEKAHCHLFPVKSGQEVARYIMPANNPFALPDPIHPELEAFKQYILENPDVSSTEVVNKRVAKYLSKHALKSPKPANKP